MTATTVDQLQIGDRFYRAADKKKVTLVKVEHNPKRTYYRTYRHFAIEAAIYDNNNGLLNSKNEPFIKPLNHDTAVVFLRHETSITPSDKLTGVL